MINEVTIEGFVSGRMWTYQDTTYFRLGSYRDPGRPAKRTEHRDEPDYITVQLQPNGLPVDIQQGMKVRVHGYIQSRYYSESLDEWLRKAKGPKSALSLTDDFRRDIQHDRVITEIVCERLQVLEKPRPAANNGKNGKVNQKPSKANGNQPIATPAEEAVSA